MLSTYYRQSPDGVRVPIYQTCEETCTLEILPYHNLLISQALLNCHKMIFKKNHAQMLVMVTKKKQKQKQL